MSIKDLGEKIKLQTTAFKNGLLGSETASKYYMTIVVILVGLSSFGLGRLSALTSNHQPISIEQETVTAQNTGPKISTDNLETTNTASVAQSIKNEVKTTQAKVGGVVASKNGTKYYYPWCGSVNNIAEKNKVWFNSETEAKAKGYTPASNCKGLKQ